MKRIFGFVFVLATLVLAPYSLKAQENPAGDISLPPELICSIYFQKNPTAWGVNDFLEIPGISEACKARVAEWLLNHDNLDSLASHPSEPDEDYTLRSIIYFAPEPYKQRAWERLKSSSDYSDIALLLYSPRGPVPDTYKNEAIRELWKRSSDLDTFTVSEILKEAPMAEDRERAAEILLNTEGVGVDDLVAVVVKAPKETQRAEGWKKFIKYISGSKSLASSERNDSYWVMVQLAYIANKAPEPYRTQGHYLYRLLEADEFPFLDLVRKGF